MTRKFFGVLEITEPPTDKRITFSCRFGKIEQFSAYGLNRSKRFALVAEFELNVEFFSAHAVLDEIRVNSRVFGDDLLFEIERLCKIGVFIPTDKSTSLFFGILRFGRCFAVVNGLRFYATAAVRFKRNGISRLSDHYVLFSVIIDGKNSVRIRCGTRTLRTVKGQIDLFSVKSIVAFQRFSVDDKLERFVVYREPIFLSVDLGIINTLISEIQILIFFGIARGGTCDKHHRHNGANNFCQHFVFVFHCTISST